MTNPTIQADTKPTVNANQHDSSQISEAIRKAEVDVEREGLLAGRIEKGSWVMLIAYGVLTLAIGLVTIWSNRVNTRLRDATKRLTELQIEKNRADSEYKTNVETEKVRQHAAQELTLSIREVKAEAGAWVEYVKGHAEARVEQVRQDALRRDRDVKQKLAEQQERAANAERRLIEVQSRLAWRAPLSPKFEDTLRSRTKGKAIIVCQEGDDEARSFAMDIWAGLAGAGWSVDPPVAGKTIMQEAGTGGGHRPGVAVVISESEGGLAMEPFLRDKPSDALMKAFSEAGITPFHILPMPQLRPPEGVIRVVVGSRFG